MAVGDLVRAATTARAPPRLQMLITSQLIRVNPKQALQEAPKVVETGGTR